MALVSRFSVSFAASLPFGLIPAVFFAAVALDDGSPSPRAEESAFSLLAAPRTLCDELAANPYDDFRKAPAVNPRDISESAIVACRDALAEHPNDPRLQANLAYALVLADPESAAEAGELTRRSAETGYPLANIMAALIFVHVEDWDTAARYFWTAMTGGSERLTRETMMSHRLAHRSDFILLFREPGYKARLHENAEHGLASALAVLGACRHGGHACEKDIAAARKAYAAAARSGNRLATAWWLELIGSEDFTLSEDTRNHEFASAIATVEQFAPPISEGGDGNALDGSLSHHRRSLRHRRRRNRRVQGANDRLVDRDCGRGRSSRAVLRWFSLDKRIRLGQLQVSGAPVLGKVGGLGLCALETRPCQTQRHELSGHAN
jgi:hypothetical protein